MIISASRRTDIPAHYSDWFFNRLKEGFVLVRNPMRPRQVSRIYLNPETVDGIVFWTKNPAPMLDRLHLLKPYTFYFQFTLTPYGPDVERALPSKEKFIIPTFRKLSELIGPERIIWRYDPIFINDSYTAEYHIRRFGELAAALSPYTRRCTISFLDFYRNTKKNFASCPIRPLTPNLQDFLARNLAATAHSCNLRIDACAEERVFSRYGIEKGRCIDDRLFGQLTGLAFRSIKDKNQRPQCGCTESIDIGAYNTCQNGCLYCYANYSEKMIPRNIMKHDPTSPLLTGNIEPDDRITDRKLQTSIISSSLRIPQK